MKFLGKNLKTIHQSVSSVAQLCLILCDPMDCSTPGFPVHHRLPELAQTHVHRVGDATESVTLKTIHSEKIFIAHMMRCYFSLKKKHTKNKNSNKSIKISRNDPIKYISK